MQYVMFGEKQASRLGFGCAAVMGRVGRRDSLHAMQLAWDTGVTLFDTARSYGYGDAEDLLGQFLKGKRERAVVMTKFGILPTQSASWKRALKPWVRAALRMAPGLRSAVRQSAGAGVAHGVFNAETLRTSLETSLRALRMDCVDALLLHLPTVSVFAQEHLLETLERVKQEGKVRCVGVATDDIAVAHEAIGAGGSFGAVQLAWPVLSADSVSMSFGEAPVLSMVSHAFGGGAMAAQALVRLQSLRQDWQVAPALREKLGGDLKKRLAEIVLHTALEQSGAQVVVASMLQGQHVRANVAAMGSERFSREEQTFLRDKLQAAGGRRTDSATKAAL